MTIVGSWWEMRLIKMSFISYSPEAFNLGWEIAFLMTLPNGEQAMHMSLKISMLAKSAWELGVWDARRDVQRRFFSLENTSSGRHLGSGC